MSWSAATSPKEAVYTVTETRWNDINSELHRSKTLSLHLGILSGVLSLVCVTLITLKYGLRNAILTCGKVFIKAALLNTFGIRISLLLGLAFAIWLNWEDLNSWKRSKLEKRDHVNDVNAEPQSSEEVSKAPADSCEPSMSVFAISDSESDGGDWATLSE